MSSRPDPFWLCHECGAQMRPIKRNGVEHCASCDGEFLEILDESVNPDPYHELPPPPPVRPGTAPRSDSQPGYSDQGGFFPSLLQGLFGGGAGGGPSQGQQGDESPGLGSRTGSPVGQGGRNPGAGGAAGGFPGGRTFEWNIGGGRGSITFGTIGGSNMGPFGPAGGSDDNRGLEDFFPFGAPPNAQARRLGDDPTNRPFTHNQPFPLDPNNARGPDDWIRALMGMLIEDGMVPGGGPPGRANLGDYVMSENGFDQILEQLMHAAGPQGPLPASDVVIEGLPRFTLTDESLEKSPFKDCPVCKDDFEVGNEVMRIPCAHIFHPDCIQPWLKVNGSCPVCRFSLVPDEANQASAAQDQASPQAQTADQVPLPPSTPASPPPDRQQSAQSNPRPPHPGRTDSGNPITSVLQRLWGQSGNANSSALATPSTEFPSRTNSSPQTPTGGPPSWLPASQSGTTLSQSGLSSPQAETPRENMSSAIPEDYRERHRMREQQRYQQQQGGNDPLHDDLD